MGIAQNRAKNIGAAHGAWGEDVAAEFLHAMKYRILDRNVRPSDRDLRLEIDIVAQDPDDGAVVFVEVKQHAQAKGEAEDPIRGVDRKKRSNMRLACQAWLWKNKWDGACRFDVIEIYGTPECSAKPEIHHIQNVNIFMREERFAAWV